ncbi:hypothetical protein [Hydrogenophaga sp.]|uniref:hypothetical protein n=1 Tax=Hydrogenophaga sp. TaxID=1904254 RepID=UPI002FCCB19A
MKLSEFEASLLKLGPNFKKSAIPASGDSINLEIDDVDFTVVASNANVDRVTVCCLFGPIPADHMSDVLRGIVKQNLELMRQQSNAGFGVNDGDLIYAFSTDVTNQPEIVQAVGRIMRSAASQALNWQASL